MQTLHESVIYFCLDETINKYTTKQLIELELK